MADGGPVLPHPLESHKAGRPGPLRATLSRLTPLSTLELRSKSRFSVRPPGTQSRPMSSSGSVPKASSPASRAESPS